MHLHRMMILILLPFAETRKFKPLNSQMQTYSEAG